MTDRDTGRDPFQEQFEIARQELTNSYNELKTNPDSRTPGGYERLFDAVGNIYSMNGLDIPNGRKILQEVGEVDPVRQALADFIKASCEIEDLDKIYLGVNVALAFQYTRNGTWAKTIETIVKKAKLIDAKKAQDEAKRANQEPESGEGANGKNGSAHDQSEQARQRKERIPV